MFQTHASGQSWSILHTSGQSCFKHILLVNPGQSFTLLVNPSHFWSITSGRSFPCHVCNFWSILHTSNQSVTLLPVTSGQSLTLLGSILHRSIRVKMQSESSTVYEILLSRDQPEHCTIKVDVFIQSSFGRSNLTNTCSLGASDQCKVSLLHVCFGANL